MIGPRLTLADLHRARTMYGGTLTEVAGAWTLVGAVIAGTPVTLGPVSGQAVA